jgi:hypothetical protein
MASMRRSLKLCWLGGFSVGGVLCLTWYLINSGTIAGIAPESLLVFQTVTFILWPPSIMLMALSGQHPMATLVIVSISLSVNGLFTWGLDTFLAKSSELHHPLTSVSRSPNE